jgi:hypothetical protein
MNDDIRMYCEMRNILSQELRMATANYWQDMRSALKDSQIQNEGVENIYKK